MQTLKTMEELKADKNKMEQKMSDAITEFMDKYNLTPSEIQLWVIYGGDQTVKNGVKFVVQSKLTITL